MVERLFLTAMYMEYSRMRPDGVVGGSHVIWTESLACEKEKKKYSDESQSIGRAEYRSFISNLIILYLSPWQF